MILNKFLRSPGENVCCIWSVIVPTNFHVFPEVITICGKVVLRDIRINIDRLESTSFAWNCFLIKNGKLQNPFRVKRCLSLTILSKCTIILRANPRAHSLEKCEIYSQMKNISWKQFDLQIGRYVDFTYFLRTKGESKFPQVRAHAHASHSTEWKFMKFSNAQILREIIFSWI